MNQKPNSPEQRSTSPALKRVRKSVYKQALLAGFLIILTAAILFAMTAAWYTNVVQSSGLMIEASAWGFDGDVTLLGGPILAAPGEEGVVEMTAMSESDEITAVSLNVSKTAMDEEIQKRIFFYVDASKTRGGETMQQVYLSNQSNYTYTLFSQGTLTLTEEVHNDALLKWQWVYDVLGYYVQGSWNENTQSMTVSEYLRPIEYEFDSAFTTFDVNGNLLSVDGVFTTEEFLQELFKTDGYPGVNVPTPNSKGYYPVAVNENGTGVWAYLCTYSEIMLNMNYDTALGEAAANGEQGSYPATLTITAQNSKIDTVKVSTPAALNAQVAAAQANGLKNVIQLEENLSLDSVLTIGENAPQQIMVDLNGKTLTVDSGTYSEKVAGIHVTEGSSLTLVNGTLAGSGGGLAIEGAGAEITLNGVTISGVDNALRVRDNEGAGTGDSKVRLNGCTITCAQEGVSFSGNGLDSAQISQLIVENTAINSGYIGIVSNGSENQAGIDIQIIDSNISGTWAAVYQPQTEGTLVVSGSTLTGYTGMALKGGTTRVIDSTITGTGNRQDPTSVGMSGFNDTGDGIYIETNYGGEILLDISGDSVVKSEKAEALRIYPESDNVLVTIHSGRFSTDVSEYCASEAECTLNGTEYVVSVTA